MSDSKLLTIKLPRQLSAKVAALARARKTTRSAIVRECIEAYEGKAPSSFGEVTGEYRGIWKDGPRDLSSNPRHLRGYGK